MMFWSLLLSFWEELNTPENYAGQPVKGATNQVGHMALAAAINMGIASAWIQIAGWVPSLWATAAAIIAVYLIVIELVTQKWRGNDTISDTAFWSLGAVLPATIISLTPSGRWIRVEELSSGFLFWLACAFVALALYVWPRLVAASGGEK
jgi:hypothetical protein